MCVHIKVHTVLTYTINKAQSVPKCFVEIWNEALSRLTKKFIDYSSKLVAKKL